MKQKEAAPSHEDAASFFGSPPTQRGIWPHYGNARPTKAFARRQGSFFRVFGADGACPMSKMLILLAAGAATLVASPAIARHRHHHRHHHHGYYSYGYGYSPVRYVRTYRTYSYPAYSYRTYRTYSYPAYSYPSYSYGYSPYGYSSYGYSPYNYGYNPYGGMTYGNRWPY